jgi:hypothetical protein
MIWHLVLLKPRPDLAAADRQAFAAAFRRAVTAIPTVRGVRVARRVTHGAGYEQSAPDAADYLAVIEFENRAGLESYLSHPAHDELGLRFGQSLSAAMVYDFELLGGGADLPADFERLIE